MLGAQQCNRTAVESGLGINIMWTLISLLLRAGAAVPGLPGATVPALEGDFSLNAANALSADLLLRAGLARLAPTHDCNAAQVQAMARTLGELA